MKTTDTLLVGFDFTNGADNTVLIVGRKDKGDVMTVVNAFQGDEARKIYNSLVTKKKGE